MANAQAFAYTGRNAAGKLVKGRLDALVTALRLGDDAHDAPAPETVDPATRR